MLSTLLPYFGCVIRPTADGIELTGAGPHGMNAAAITPQVHRAPFSVRAVARTDSTNLRLYWHVGEIIFNWECGEHELRVHDPMTGQQSGWQGRGFIEPGGWHEIVWTIEPDAMRVTVDGEERYAGSGQYQGIEAPVGIGPCFGSTVTVRELDVGPSRDAVPRP